MSKASSPPVRELLESLGIFDLDGNVLVGINCTPITFVGTNGNTCVANTLCCEDNRLGGAVAIGCEIVNANL
ncbi:hydrophobin [Moniliophthora roreri]|nr:hydrophobin [Moniliophthora roreri]